MSRADARERAATDKTLAMLCRLPRREIIDAAAELLRAGYLVLACDRGRWLGTFAEGVAYRDALRARGRRIMVRAQLVERAIARHESSLFDQQDVERAQPAVAMEGAHV